MMIVGRKIDREKERGREREREREREIEKKCNERRKVAPAIDEAVCWSMGTT